MSVTVIVKPEEHYPRMNDLLFPEGSTILDPANILQEEDCFIDFEGESRFFQQRRKHEFEFSPVFVTKLEYSNESKIIEGQISSFLFEDQDGSNVDWTSKLEGHLEFENMASDCSANNSHSKRSKEEVQDRFQTMTKTGNIRDLTESILDEKLDYDTEIGEDIIAVVKSASASKNKRLVFLTPDSNGGLTSTTGGHNISFGLHSPSSRLKSNENDHLTPFDPNLDHRERVNPYYTTPSVPLDSFCNELFLVEKTAEKKEKNKRKSPLSENRFLKQMRFSAVIKKSKKPKGVVEKDELGCLIREASAQIKCQKEALEDFALFLDEDDFESAKQDRKREKKISEIHQDVNDIGMVGMIYKNYFNQIIQNSDYFINSARRNCGQIKTLRISVDMEQELRSINSRVIRKSQKIEQSSLAKDRFLKEKEEEIKQLEHRIAKLEETLGKKDKAWKQKDSIIEDLKLTIKKSEEALAKNNETIKSIKDQLEKEREDHRSHMELANARCKDLSERAGLLEHHKQAYESKITSMQTWNEQLNLKIGSLETEKNESKEKLISVETRYKESIEQVEISQKKNKEIQARLEQLEKSKQESESKVLSLDLNCKELVKKSELSEKKLEELDNSKALLSKNLIFVIKSLQHIELLDESSSFFCFNQEEKKALKLSGIRFNNNLDDGFTQYLDFAKNKIFDACNLKKAPNSKNWEKLKEFFICCLKKISKFTGLWLSNQKNLFTSTDTKQLNPKILKSALSILCRRTAKVIVAAFQLKKLLEDLIESGFCFLDKNQVFELGPINLSTEFILLHKKIMRKLLLQFGHDALAIPK